MDRFNFQWLSECDFQTEILSHLGSIESKQNIMYEELHSLQGDVKNSASVANDVLNFTKSAHKRIDSIKTDAMVLKDVTSALTIEDDEYRKTFSYIIY